jgi:hypothetical protein
MHRVPLLWILSFILPLAATAVHIRLQHGIPITEHGNTEHARHGRVPSGLLAEAAQMESLARQALLASSASLSSSSGDGVDGDSDGEEAQVVHGEDKSGQEAAQPVDAAAAAAAAVPQGGAAGVDDSSSSSNGGIEEIRTLAERIVDLSKADVGGGGGGEAAEEAISSSAVETDDIGSAEKSSGGGDDDEAAEEEAATPETISTDSYLSTFAEPQEGGLKGNNLGAPLIKSDVKSPSDCAMRCIAWGDECKSFDWTGDGKCYLGSGKLSDPGNTLNGKAGDKYFERESFDVLSRAFAASTPGKLKGKKGMGKIALRQFRNGFRGKKGAPGNGQKQGVLKTKGGSAEDCAQFCMRNEPCQSFDYNPREKVCILMQYTAEREHISRKGADKGWVNYERRVFNAPLATPEQLAKVDTKLRDALIAGAKRSVAEARGELKKWGWCLKYTFRALGYARKARFNQGPKSSFHINWRYKSMASKFPTGMQKAQSTVLAKNGFKEVRFKDIDDVPVGAVIVWLAYAQSGKWGHIETKVSRDSAYSDHPMKIRRRMRTWGVGVPRVYLPIQREE